MVACYIIYDWQYATTWQTQTMLVAELPLTGLSWWYAILRFKKLSERLAALLALMVAWPAYFGQLNLLLVGNPFQ